MNPNPRRRLALALLSLPVAASLLACGATGNKVSDAAASRSAAGIPAPATPDSAGFDAAAGGGSGAKAADAVIRRSVIATGSLGLTTRSLADVRRESIDLVTGLGGHVAGEQSRSDVHGRLDRVDLTLRVPAASFERTLDALSRLGTVRHREQSVEDVTTQVIDTDARVKAQAASVASMEQLLARARTIAEILSIENQLASRQADLDSLRQQQKWLADQTSMSTVQLSLTRPPATVVTRTGFLGGLERGWHALGRTTVAVGAALGAVLPFASVAALVAVPGWVLLRRRRTASTAPATEA